LLSSDCELVTPISAGNTTTQRTHSVVRSQVFGVTRDPFIIYTSNIFAILSLRALYGFVATVMSELRFLDKSVALVLGFIGAGACQEKVWAPWEGGWDALLPNSGASLV